MYAGIDNLLSLKMLYARIARGDVEESDARAAEVALRDAASLHPGHPTIDITWQSGGIPFGHNSCRRRRRRVMIKLQVIRYPHK